MAKVVDKAVQSSISALSANRVACVSTRPALRFSTGRFPESSSFRRGRKSLAVACTLSEVRTKEALEAGRRSQNGLSTAGSQNRQVGEVGTVALKASITIGKKRRPDNDELTKDRMDVVADLLGQKITLQFVSVDIDPVTKVGKRSPVAKIRDWAEKASVVADFVQYTAELVIDKSFGTPGAVIVTNKHQNELFLESIALIGYQAGPVHFLAHSWVHSEENNPVPRVFFSNQVYLPSATPQGLLDLREQNLEMHRGNGKGIRKDWENIFDYDVYNDLGDVDKDANLARPTLGGSKAHPYPRRNRTGRARAQKDPSTESRVPGKDTPYVPRDECFEQIKQEAYFSTALRGLVHQYIPDIADYFLGRPEEFDSFDEIDRLYFEGIQLKSHVDRVQHFLQGIIDLPVTAMLPDVFRSLAEATTDRPTTLLKYPQPQLLSRDKFAWLRDDEFGRQALTGLNPCAIQRLQVFPPVSALDDPELYGPKESAIKAHHIENQLEGYSIEQALEQGKLFILDYHDVYIPFINRINALDSRASYASRTIFFLTKTGTLKPLAIELSLPPPKPCQRVFVPSNSSTGHWLFKLAKAHVGGNDAGFHQLASHWVRTHACTEPYVIAANRQLSPLHPVYRLLRPHLRYTMEINAAARQSLISADGVIENAFLPGRYSMELSSAFYGLKWRFDEQGLPQDLISRGMAVEDPTAPHGLKLLIEDYPFANDGLLVWSSIETWVTDYISIYYKESRVVQEDKELQKWWEEIKTRGHADKKDEAWWPQLQTCQDLIGVLTTMIWVNSALHAAVNFGQYDYAGYMPNKPTLMRRFIPEPHDKEYAEFLSDPQLFMLTSLPSQTQSTVLMAVLESLSTHSPDEEYLGSDTHPHWFGGREADDAFKRFQHRLAEIDIEIHKRNGNPQLRNRNGAGVLPYELLLPTSEPGITGRGVPNSISI